MNPNNETAPKIYSADKDVPVAISSDQTKIYPNEDELFVIKPAEKKPLDKKSVFFVATLSIIGVILLLVVLVFALIGSASTLANDYRRLALDQVTKLDKPLNELKPEAVLNKRNLENPSKAIDISKQSLPTLESVLFVGEWSERYKQTAILEKRVDSHYQKIATYYSSIKNMIAFDNTLGEITSQEPNLDATINPSNSLSIRSASGSYSDYSKKIQKIPVSSDLTKTKQQLVEIYQKKSDIYLTWATSVESGNKDSEAKAKADLLTESSNASVLMEDENYIMALNPSYKKIINDHKLIKNQLAN